MKKYFHPGLAVTSIMILVIFILFKSSFYSNKKPLEWQKEENDEKEMGYVNERAKYEFDMLKDPATGKIPYGVFDQELAYAKTLPVKDYGSTARGQDLNNYNPAGPNNIGGRTRALAYDVRYNGTTNKVILAGSVSGGIMRSTDGGSTWTRVSPDNDIHNVSVVAQDPRGGFQDTWYAGGGEILGNSASELGAVYFSQGIWKSTNNGATWTRLTLTVTDINGAILPTGTLENFDNAFDYVHKIVVNPVNGHIYIACHRRLIRSTDGGTSFNAVFANPASAAFAPNGQMDVVCSPTGKLFLAVSGSNPDFSLRGVWTSATGNANSWTRIAGGSNLGVDSVAGWRANSYDFQVVSGSNYYEPKRIIMAMAPSDENIIYILYENGLSNTAPDNAPEADLFKLNTTGGINTWTNLSANVPDFPGSNAATDPFAVQGGYDMTIAVKPGNANFVLLGGTSLYRSTDGFATGAGGNLTWVGGYGNTLPTLTFYPNTHPDMHNAVFNPNPSNSNEVLCSNDGGIQMTSDITANLAPTQPVAWTMISNYQTLQYYYVAIDPETGINDFVGGAQDNGTQFRDKNGILGTAVFDSNNHRRIFSGDGCGVGFSKITGGSQFVYASIYLGQIYRISAVPGFPNTAIRPNTLTPNPGSTGDYGEFVTNFRLDPDNTEDLYYVNFNRLFRTTSASTVTTSTWTELTNAGTTIDPDGATNGFNTIRAMGFSRGPYLSTHALYLGTTNGKIFRIDDPGNAAASYIPVNITPSGNTGSVQDIAVNPNNDDEVLAVTSNYGVTSIWWTNNGKSATPTWKNAEGNLNLPSVRSCVIVVKKDASNNPSTEYYVGTSVGLYSAVNIGPTLIGGGSPTWQREGGSVLNYAVIQSMSYRPADNTLLVGTHGNGLYYASLGTPNFNPNGSTGINDPITNDKNFIKKVFPTYSSDIVSYETGNMFTIKKISAQLFNMSGQEILSSDKIYQNGNINISRLADGAYILSITSDDKKYRHLQKIIKK